MLCTPALVDQSPQWILQAPSPSADLQMLHGSLWPFVKQPESGDLEDAASKRTIGSCSLQRALDLIQPQCLKSLVP
jgi:hypothetical protein